MNFHLATPSAPVQETLQAAREFFAWANKTWPHPGGNENHPWNRLGTLLGDQPMKSFDSLFDGSDAHLLEDTAPSAPVQAVPDGSEATDALKALDSRLRECFGLPITAEEAYDSFYQEMVADALNPQPPKESTAQSVACHAERN